MLFHKKQFPAVALPEHSETVENQRKRKAAKKQQQLCLKDGEAGADSSSGSAPQAITNVTLSKNGKKTAEVEIQSVRTQDCTFVIILLKYIDPQLVTDHTLTGLIPVGKRKHDFDILIKVFGYATGWDVMADISEELKNLEDFKEMLRQDYINRGCRLKYMTMSPQLPDCTIYEYDKDAVALTHRFTKEVIELDETTQQTLGNVTLGSVYSGWSEQQAFFRTPGSKVRIMLSELFHNQFPENVPGPPQNVAKKMKYPDASPQKRSQEITLAIQQKTQSKRTDKGLIPDAEMDTEMIPVIT